MILKQKRYKTNEKGTLSTLKVYTHQEERARFVACEDPKQAEKIAGETRIPAGKYQITLRKEGGMLPKYQLRCPFPHPGMLWIRKVPNFEYCYIHVGNSKKDTDGCVLVGMFANPGTMKVHQSKVAYSRLYQMIEKALRTGKVELQITDEPQPIRNDSPPPAKKSQPTDRTNHPDREDPKGRGRR